MSERGFKDVFRMSYNQLFEHVLEVVENQYFHLLRSQISKEDLEDIHSLAYMQAFDHLRLFKISNKGSLRTYMYTSIRNSFTLAINRYKVRNHPSIDDMSYKIPSDVEEVHIQIEPNYTIETFTQVTGFSMEDMEDRKLKLFCGYYLLLGERYGTETKRFRQGRN